MSITWRISPSRPITGSIFPSRARWVRLVVNWSRAGVLDRPPLASPGTAPSSSPASPPAEASAKRTVCTASCEPSVSLAKSCLSSSRLKRTKSLEPR
ncbi:hypothetical protein G6F24_017480 [Rhizopus arrhizus]|nr:hypothetical protein G6F24_017480 [Rhizopus arrhizus]